MSEILAVYADGGCIGCNPSPEGGTWAWCHASTEKRLTPLAFVPLRLTAHDSGIIRPGEHGLPASEPISNNVMEYYALARCLKVLPERWSGPVYSDSRITLCRFFEGGANRGIPVDWVMQVHRTILPRLGLLTPVLLSGHPTKAQLAVGEGKGGRPVSSFNVWCDAAAAAAGVNAR